MEIITYTEAEVLEQLTMLTQYIQSACICSNKENLIFELPLKLSDTEKWFDRNKKK
jgi:hypothetical protein